ncbi:hypothetical protein NQ314_003262 [Rhamnusium bicolor]|uniref:Acylglycerol kinase, mitochondrial n=1 Tax=Rhamnusium bicolor TaxID=1586634 RepID=A0AAV8ZMV2_9CUCU|nr:hypothetical protein NQ314_003262 [Rhamnusium bicolor]
MFFIIRIAKTLRNHWKKSTFAGALLTYGFISGKRYLETQDLMRVYCQRAAKYGREPIPLNINPRNVTVILNPNANKRKSSEEFEKYCAPLLYLAGISVDVIKTESEGHAKTLMESVGGMDAIVVAGGDGTLSEVVTGLLRRTNENTSNLVPLGILPLGKNNTVAKNFFPTEKRLEKVRCLADATMAVIEDVTKPADIMKIEVLNEDINTSNKAIYAVVGIKWGAYRDAEAKKDSYWYFGAMRKYVTYIFNGFKNNLSWNCEATLNYSSPCEGCSNCYKNKQNIQPKSGWFHKKLQSRLSRKITPQAKYLGIDNPDCQKTHQKKISTADLALLTSNAIPSNLNSREIPKLQIQIGPGKVEYIDFVKNGWNSENGQSREVKEIIEARTVEINPEKEEKESWFSIDNEYYEVKPIKITLLPKIINMFCKKEERAL